jgi:Domain of unknown function (DUF4270)
MEKHFAIKSISILTIISVFLSCAEPTSIGSELQESVNALSTDTLTIRMMTVPEDSVKVFDSNQNAAFSTFLCGNYMDELMGKTEASIFSQLRLTSPPPDAFYAENGSILDSVVLHLPYNFNSFYGDTKASYTFEVYQMTEDMDKGDTYYSNKTFQYDPTPIGTLTFTPPASTDTIDYVFPETETGSVLINDTSQLVNHLRIPLINSFGNIFTSLAEDNEILTETSDLLTFLKGIHIRSVQADDPGMLAFRLDELVSSSSPGAGMTFYYHYPSITGDSILHRRYSLYTNSTDNQYMAKTTSVTTEYLPEVENTFDMPVLGDDVAYIQALTGPNIKFEIPNVSAFRNTIINKAELVITVASAEDSLRRTPPQIVVATRSGDGTYQVTDDVLFALGRGFGVFGGQEEEIGNLRQYRFNLSAVFQELVDIENEPLYLRIFLKQEQVSRMTVFGPEHSQYPAKITLVYTTLPE